MSFWKEFPEKHILLRRHWMAQRPEWIEVRDVEPLPELALLEHLDAGASIVSATRPGWERYFIACWAVGTFAGVT
jgi:hypothetical protein